MVFIFPFADDKFRSRRMNKKSPDLIYAEMLS